VYCFARAVGSAAEVENPALEPQKAAARTAFSLLSHPTNVPFSVRNLSFGKGYARLLGGVPGPTFRESGRSLVGGTRPAEGEILG
jgi:hypothetical protein